MWLTTRVNSGTFTVFDIYEWQAPICKTKSVYADSSCLVSQGKNVKEIEWKFKLNRTFLN